MVTLASIVQAKGDKLVILNVKLNSIGKSPFPHDVKFVDINPKYITSALYVYLEVDNDLTSILINDSLFNYDYFNIYPDIENKKAKITVEKYLKGDLTLQQLKVALNCP